MMKDGRKNVGRTTVAWPRLNNNIPKPGWVIRFFFLFYKHMEIKCFRVYTYIIRYICAYVCYIYIYNYLYGNEIFIHVPPIHSYVRGGLTENCHRFTEIIYFVRILCYIFIARYVFCPLRYRS